MHVIAIFITLMLNLKKKRKMFQQRHLGISGYKALAETYGISGNDELAMTYSIIGDIWSISDEATSTTLFSRHMSLLALVETTALFSGNLCRG